jgi:FkbM family methyltransferase
MSVLSSLRSRVTRGRYTRTAADLARPAYRALRTRWLRLRHPRGGFVTGNGVRVFVDFQCPTYAWYDADAPNLSFDQRVIRTALAQSGGNVFIDVGAHCGFFAAYVAGLPRKASPAMKILAFEPDQNHVACLRKTLAQHYNADIVIFPIAVSDSSGRVQMYRCTNASCLHSYPDPAGEPAYTVDAVTLDWAVETHLAPGDRIAVIKIDVDGAEPGVFRGAERVVREHRPIILTEFAPQHLRSNKTDPRRFFAELCSRFKTYWIRYDSQTISEVRTEDYDEIEARIDIVTDLLLSDRALDLVRF